MAGAGKRLVQLTKHKPKALVRLADKRLLDHILARFGHSKKHILWNTFLLSDI